MKLSKEQNNFTTSDTRGNLKDMCQKIDLSFTFNDDIILIEAPTLGTCVTSGTESYSKHTAKIYKFPEGKVLLDIADDIYATGDSDYILEDSLEDSKGGAPKMEAMPILSSYIESAMAASEIETLEDGTYYAHISLCPGVWANEETKEQALIVLREVFEEWLIFKLRDRDPLPSFHGIEINKVVEECWDQ